MRTNELMALACLFTATAVTALSAQKPMPPETGVLASQKQIQVRLEQPSKTLSAAEVRSALTGAVAAWNAALPADLKLVEAPSGGAPPAGEVVFLVRFDNDPSHFGKNGIDEIGDTRGIVTRASNTAVVAVFLVDKPGTFSTTGVPTTHDLQLVITHELGHALGVAHDADKNAVPPIMAPMLETNGPLLARTRQTLAALRQLSADDKQLLGDAMLKRKSRDVSGSYLGSLKVESLLNGTGSMVGSSLPVRVGEFVVTYEAGKVVVLYKGQRCTTPVVDLLLDPAVKLDFPDCAADGKALVSLKISRGNTPDELVVEAVIEPPRARYSLKGTVVRK